MTKKDQIHVHQKKICLALSMLIDMSQFTNIMHATGSQLVYKYRTLIYVYQMGHRACNEKRLCYLFLKLYSAILYS